MARRIGWRREGSKGRFRYVDADGRRITDEEHLERIRALAIPPAWQDVWTSPSSRAKLQATGRDAAGRKQYLYHADYRAQQEQPKYDKLIRFAERLPALREVLSGGRPFVLRQPGRRGAVSGRPNDRRFPTPTFARGSRARYRARSGRARDIEPPAFLANSLRTRGSVNCA